MNCVFFLKRTHEKRKKNYLIMFVENVTNCLINRLSKKEGLLDVWKKHEPQKRCLIEKKNRKPKDTNWDQTFTPKSSNTLLGGPLSQEGVQFLTLLGPFGCSEDNSPAYYKIYIYASFVHTYTDAGGQTQAALSMASLHLLKFGRHCVLEYQTTHFWCPFSRS